MLHVFQNWDEGTSFRTKMNIGLYFSAEREIGLFWNSSSYYVIIIFFFPDCQDLGEQSQKPHVLTAYGQEVWVKAVCLCLSLSVKLTQLEFLSLAKCFHFTLLFISKWHACVHLVK